MGATLKLYEQGKKEGCGGVVTVIRGGDGQMIPPDWARKQNGDEIAGFEFKDPTDRRALSSCGRNGIYCIKVERVNDRALVFVSLYWPTGEVLHLLQRAISATEVRDDNVLGLETEMKNLLEPLKDNMRIAIHTAILRTFCEAPEGYSLDPIGKTPIEAQLAARQKVGCAVPQKTEVDYGRIRPDRTVGAVSAATPVAV